MSSRRRSKLEVKIDILEAIKDGIQKPTKIMYKANMSWKPLTEILNNFVEGGLVNVIETPTGDRRTSKIYELTDDGHKALMHWYRMPKI